MMVRRGRCSYHQAPPPFVPSKTRRWAWRVSVGRRGAGPGAGLHQLEHQAAAGGDGGASIGVGAGGGDDDGLASFVDLTESSAKTIYCIDDEVITKHLELLTTHTNLLPFSMKQELKKGGYIKNDQMMLKIQEERVTMSIYDFALKGKHNAYNTMAASIAATTLGIRKEKIREAVSNFHSLEHRMEFVATVRGVDFINDSKATNVNSTWYALESMQKPTILILGGVDKGNDYALVADLVKDKVKAIVLRINSPGGDALASELICREIELNKKTKPVLVVCATASICFPLCVTVTRAGGAGKSISHTS